MAAVLLVGDDRVVTEHLSERARQLACVDEEIADESLVTDPGDDA